MGGLLTVPLFLKSFPQVDLVNDVSFKNAWVTGMLLMLKSALDGNGLLVQVLRSVRGI